MKVFVWPQVDYLTDNYHNGGGLVICASDLAEARKLFLEDSPRQTTCDCLTREPTYTVECAPDSKPFVSIHPDAGCC